MSVMMPPVRSPLTTGEMGPITFPVRTEAQGLDDTPDPPLSYELTGLDRAPHLEALGERDGPEPSRRRDGLLDLVQLIESDAARLVGDDILAVREGLDGDGGAAVGNGGGDDHVHGRIAEQARRIVDPRRIGPLVADAAGDRGVGIVRTEPDELAALTGESADLAEGMRMVQTDSG